MKYSHLSALLTGRLQVLFTGPECYTNICAAFTVSALVITDEIK